MATGEEQREVHYSGAVQGVGFRYTVRSLAARLQVTGFVRNLFDGRVQLVVEGTSAEIELLLKQIQTEMGRYISTADEQTRPATGRFKRLNPVLIPPAVGPSLRKFGFQREPCGPRKRNSAKRQSRRPLFFGETMDFLLSAPLPLAMMPVWVQPLWVVGTGAVAAVALLGAVVMLMRLVTPKVAAIAWTTAKEGVSQPLFYVLLAIGVFLLLIFPIIPYNTFGEDVKVVKETGLTLIMVLSIMLALWNSSVSIADEIEGRTGADGAVQADRPAAVHPREISGNSRPCAADVHRLGLAVSQHGLV